MGIGNFAVCFRDEGDDLKGAAVMKKTLKVFLGVLLVFGFLVCLASCGEKTSERDKELVGTYKLESILEHGGRNDAEKLEIEGKIELKSDKSGEYVYKRYGFKERHSLKWNAEHIIFESEKPAEKPAKFEYQVKDGTLTLKQIDDGNNKVLIFRKIGGGGQSESAK